MIGDWLFYFLVIGDWKIYFLVIEILEWYSLAVYMSCIAIYDTQLAYDDIIVYDGIYNVTAGKLYVVMHCVLQYMHTIL